MRKLNICVTGANGFLGSKLLEKLNHNDTNVFVIGRNLKRVQSNNNIHNIRCLEYDLTKPMPKNLFSHIDCIDCLIHLAAYVPKHESEDDIEKSIQTNISGTIKLIEAAGKVTKKIIYSSTLEVYGAPENLPITENHPTEPLTFYGASKLSAEKYLHIYSTKTGSKLIILRFTSIYGPGEIYDRALPNYIRSVISDEPPVIYGTGMDLRDYLYVDDAVDAIMLAIKSDCCGVYNIASGSTYTKKDVADRIIRLSGKNLKLAFNHADSKLKNIAFDIKKAKNDLSFSPNTDLNDGLMREIQWYKNQRAGD